MALIWRLGLVRMILRPPRRLFSKLTIQQWRFGSLGIKPTTLMYSNARLGDALGQCEEPCPVRPTIHLLGISETREFVRHVLKSIPPN